MRFMGKLKKLVRDEDGNVLVVCASCIPLLIGAAGFAIDTIHLSLAKRELQRAADSGALAAAFAVTQDTDPKEAVKYDLEVNSRVKIAATPTVEQAPAGTEWAGDQGAVRVRMSTTRATPFFGFFIEDTQTLNADATARAFGSGTFCVQSLYDGTSPGIVVTGNADLDLSCGMSTNSRGSPAVTAGGSSTVRASPIMAMGGIPPSSSFVGGTDLQPYSAKQKDPLAHVPDPPPSYCSNSLGAMAVQPNSTQTFSPGCYSSIDLKGTATLNPGIYYVDGGDVSFGAQTNVTGHGVTIVMTGPNGNAGDIKLNGGASLDLKAPATGPYKGVVLYRDRRAPVIDVKFNGGGNLSLQGALYLPTTDLDMLGNFNLTAECLQIVGRILTFKGTADLRNNCPANSGSSHFNATVVRLVR